jgi:hypothetical protein
MADSPAINTDTGEPQSPSGWSQDDPAQAEIARRGLTSPAKPPKADLSPQSTGNLALPDTSNPAQPKLQDVPKAPNMEFREALDVFKNPAVVLAGLGSLFTRRPLTTAMNAAAEAMNGYQQGQEDTFKLKQKEWEDATKAALEQNNIELEKYKEAWDLHDRNVQESFAKMTAASSGFDDPVMRNAVASHNFPLVEKLITMRETAKEKMQESLALRDAMMGRGIGNPSSIALQRYLQEHPDASPEEIQAFVNSGRAGRSAITMFMNKWLAEHPNASADEVKTAAQTFTTETTAQNRFLSGPQGNTIRSLNVVVSHLQTMQNLADALKNGDLRLFNEAAQRWSEETGQPAPTNFDTAKQIVGAEIIKSLGVAGAGTQAERTEAADAFNRARSPQQIAGAINTAKALLAGQLKGMRRQFTSSTGLSADRFDQMLEPETRDYLGGGGTGAAPAGGGGQGQVVKQNGHLYQQQPDGSWKGLQ